MSPEYQLAADIAGFTHDPYRFVRFVFPWGSGDLEGESGPDVWQTDVLKAIGQGTLSVAEALRVAVVSGHGIGKTALTAWIILWAMSTRPHLAGVVTANTKAQLNDKSWRELSVWHKRAINQRWFKWTATKFYQADHPETWFVSAVPWSKEKPEAFAGLHAEHVLMIFDEASAVDNCIWETAEGAMTTKGAIWLVLGNPTRNSGRFYECFGRYKHRWITRQIDSRQAKKANKAQLDQWVSDYGEDSDFVRVRVRGVFPRAGSNQLISSEAVSAARGKHIIEQAFIHAPKIMALDVARHGDDQSALAIRQGLYCFPLKAWRIPDLMRLADLVAQEYAEENPDALFVDAGGMGLGVIDRLRQLHIPVFPVDFGGSPLDAQKFFNKRAEMWWGVRDWLDSGGVLPDDEELCTDLTSPEYSYSGDKGQIQLEKKGDMKKRGLASPDKGDALAMTFAKPVFKRSDYSKNYIAEQKSSLWDDDD
jgi:hypothetical protein